jgi:uncharacterized membrane protein
MANRSPIDLDPGHDPWDQQPRETSRQYERFLRFRDLGRMRSLTTVNKVLTGIGDELTYGTIRIQSHTYRWTERAQAWDRHQDEVDRDRIIQARRDMIDRHQEIAGALAKKALTALRVLKGSALDPADVVRFLKLATDLEIRALGEPNQTIAVTGPAGGPIVTEDITHLTDEERRVRLKEVAIELARRAGLKTTENDNEE